MKRFGLTRQWLSVLLCAWLAPWGASGATGAAVFCDTIDALRIHADSVASAALPDTTRTATPDSEKVGTATGDTLECKRINFDPLAYRLQKRHLEIGDTFRTRHFYDHLYVGFYTGMQQIAPKSSRELKTAFPLSLFMGYEFTRLHSLRLTGTYVEYGVEGSNANIKQAGIDLDYLFNLTSYLYGYRKLRLFSLSGLIGGGIIDTHFQGNRAWVLKGQVGAHMAVRLGRNGELFAEPFVALTTDKIDHSGTDNPSIYDVLYGVRAGLAINFNTSAGYYKNVLYNGNLFFDFSQGVTMFYRKGGMPLLQTMGTNYEVAVGKWLDPAVGIRVSGSVSDFYWGHKTTRGSDVGGVKVRPAYEERLKGTFFTGRLEGMLDPVHFSRRWRKNPHMFDLNLLLGYEYGWMMKYGVESVGANGMQCYYNGVSGAMQLLYNVNSFTALFVEPRALLATYHVPYRNSSAEKSYTDKVGSVNVGVRVTRPTRAERAALGTQVFEPYLFVGAQLGGIKQVVNHKQVGDKSFNVLGAASVGYQYAPLAAAKLQIEYMLLNKNQQTTYEVESGNRTLRYRSLWRHQYGYLNTKLAYMLNLTNLYQKYNASRRLNLYAQGGPMYSFIVTQGAKLYSEEIAGGQHPVPLIDSRTGEGAWALFGGMIADFRIDDRWSVYAEPEVQYYLKKGFVGGGPVNRLNDIILKFSLGTTYRF